jgi:hypothetical protein
VKSVSGERLDAVKGVLVTGPHLLEPERVHCALRNLGTGPVGPEERAAGEILVELRAVARETPGRAFEPPNMGSNPKAAALGQASPLSREGIQNLRPGLLKISDIRRGDGEAMHERGRGYHPVQQG